jgi:ABC-type phosphate transport system substrate-binding protein
MHISMEPGRVGAMLEARSKPASFFSYRAVGTGEGQAELAADTTLANAMFAAGDVPMAATGIVNVPIGVHTVSVFVNIPGARTVRQWCRL